MKIVHGRWCGVLATSFVLLMTLTLATAGTVAAATSSSLAEIDWSSPRLIVSPGMTLTYLNKATVISASVEANSNEQTEQRVSPDWVDDSAYVNYGSSSLSGWGRAETANPTDTDPGLIASRAYAESNLGGYAFVQNMPHQTGTFTVSGNGTITLEVPYSLNVNLIAANLSEYASAVAEAFAVLSISAGPRTSAREQISQLVNGAVFYNEKRSGTLSLSLQFTDGQKGTFMTLAHTEGSAYSVPEPSTLLLIGGGIAGLMLQRRRNRGVRA